MKHSTRAFGVALLLGAAATAAHAGGPHLMYDTAKRVPYAWHLDNWPAGRLPVYTDLGNLKNSNPLIDNARAVAITKAAWEQWNAVPSSSFQSTVAGTLQADVTLANVAEWLTNFNGGGVHVIYDADGQIFSQYLGLSSVLGLTVLEYASPDSNELLEVTVLLNGTQVRATDIDAGVFSGVFTHEFGHAANLTHSQANGAVVLGLDPPQPFGCPAPWTGTANTSQLETMYPSMNVNPGASNTGTGQFTVDRMDDIAAISDLYPAPGWPDSHGTVRGTIRSAVNLLGDLKEVTGVNLIARNVADPFNDFTSTVSGSLTRGTSGPDGTFEMHGLTPGATYVVYADNLRSGAFPYPRLVVLPGPEEYYNGEGESEDGRKDIRCKWTLLTAGTDQTADIRLNKVNGAPELTVLPVAGTPNGMTPDGRTVVGRLPSGQVYTWSEEDGTVLIPASEMLAGNPGISDDGTKVAAATKVNGVVQWGIYENGAWTIVPPAPGTVPCTSGPEGLTWGSLFGFSGDGSTLAGFSYTQGCASAGIQATKWTAAGGWQILPKDPAFPTRVARANSVSYDGSVITGRQDTNGSVGVYWKDGQEHYLGHPTDVPFFGNGLYVTRDGSTILGGGFTDNVNTPGRAYRFFTATNTWDAVSEPVAGSIGFATTSNDDASVVFGFTQTGGLREAKMWTAQLGWFNMTDFLNVQGTNTDGIGLFSPSAGAISADGRTWATAAASIGGNIGLHIKTPTTVLCHWQGEATGRHALAVSFPDGLEAHMAHGDTLGPCQHGGE
jgi:hypothetical protein